MPSARSRRRSVAGARQVWLGGVIGVVIGVLGLGGCGSTPLPSASIEVSAAPTTSPVAPTPIGTASPTPAPSVEATLSPAPTPRVVTSDDGLLRLEFAAPAGVPGDVPLRAISRGLPDLPPELVGLEVRAAFYEIEPDDLAFIGSARVERRVSYRALGLDPAEDGVPLLALALRTSDGSWEWLEEAAIRSDGRVVVASGLLSRTGSLFAFGGRAFVRNLPTATSLEAEVGSGVTLTSELQFPGVVEDPPILGAPQTTVSSDVVELGESLGPGGGRISQEVVCLRPGLAEVSLSYDVLNVGANSALFKRLGLEPATVEVSINASVTCTDSSTSPP